MLQVLLGMSTLSEGTCIIQCLGLAVCRVVPSMVGVVPSTGETPAL